MTAESLNARLIAQLDALERAVSTAPADGLNHRPQADKWSAHDHVAHLACYHERFLERIRGILSADRPGFRRYRAEEDPEWPAWQRLTTGEALDRLRALRRKLIDGVASLTGSQLERVGVHPVFGPLTIPQWIDFFLFHEGHHAYVVITLAWRGDAGGSSA